MKPNRLPCRLLIRLLIRFLITSAAALAITAFMLRAFPARTQAGENGELRPRPHLLVSGDWLAENLHKENPGRNKLRVVDLRDVGNIGVGTFPVRNGLNGADILTHGGRDICAPCRN